MYQLTITPEFKIVFEPASFNYRVEVVNNINTFIPYFTKQTELKKIKLFFLDEEIRNWNKIKTTEYILARSSEWQEIK